MTLTKRQALDDMFRLFFDAWRSGAPNIVGTIPEVRWPGVEDPVLPGADNYWCRVSTQEVDASQSTLKSGVAPDEAQRYTVVGLLFVQLFCPMSDSRGQVRGEELAELVRSTFRGAETPGGVWFRNPRSTQLATQDGALRFNIVVDYEYDSIA